MLKDTLLYLAQNPRLRDFAVQNKIARNISRRFVAGETLEDALQATSILNRRGIQVAPPGRKQMRRRRRILLPLS
jgi:proline dehydrogenase